MASARSVAGVLALIVAGSTLTACSGDPEPEPAPSTSATSASPSETAPPSSLTVGVFGDKEHLAAYDRVVDSFRAENPAVDVEVKTFDDARSAADAALAALDFEADLDVFLADDRYLAELVLTDGLEPVDALLEERGLEYGDDYQRVALTAFSANSRLQCMPAEVSPLVVYVNTDLVRRAEPLESPVEDPEEEPGDVETEEPDGADQPDEEATGDPGDEPTEEPFRLPDEEDSTWSWEEFTQLARAIAAVDGPGPVQGVHLPPTVEMLTALVRAGGGDVVDDVLDPDRLTLASDESRTAIAEAAALMRDPSVAPRPGELGRAGARGMFADGRLGMFVGTRADLPDLRDAEGLQFDVLPLPSLGRSRSVSLMTGWCLDGDSGSVDVGADFIAHAVGPEGSRIAASSGAIVPSGLEAVHDEAFTQPGQQPRNAHVYATAIRRSDPMPFAVRWDDVVAEVEALVRRLWTRPRIDLEETFEARLAKLDTASEGILAEPE